MSSAIGAKANHLGEGLHSKRPRLLLQFLPHPPLSGARFRLSAPRLLGARHRGRHLQQMSPPPPRDLPSFLVAWAGEALPHRPHILRLQDILPSHPGGVLRRPLLRRPTRGWRPPPRPPPPPPRPPPTRRLEELRRPRVSPARRALPGPRRMRRAKERIQGKDMEEQNARSSPS